METVCILIHLDDDDDDGNDGAGWKGYSSANARVEQKDEKSLSHHTTRLDSVVVMVVVVLNEKYVHMETNHPNCIICLSNKYSLSAWYGTMKYRSTF